MSAATSPGTGLAYRPAAGLRRLGHGPLLVLRHDLRPCTPSSRLGKASGTEARDSRDQGAAGGDSKQDLEASPWEPASLLSEQGLRLGFGSVATSGLPASGCSA